MTTDSIILPRVYTDADGETHFDEIALPLLEREFSPPSPAGYRVSEALPAREMHIMRTPANYRDEWHSAPNRMLVTLLSGRLKLETSDGNFRIIEPGQQFLHDNVDGKGHRLIETSDGPYDLALVSLE